LRRSSPSSSRDRLAQHDAFTLAQIVLIGLLLGWIRWASGSTLLTIMLHMLTNLTACIQAAIKIAWMG